MFAIARFFLEFGNINSKQAYNTADHISTRIEFDDVGFGKTIEDQAPDHKENYYYKRNFQFDLLLLKNGIVSHVVIK